MNPYLQFNVQKLVLAPMVRICGLPMRLVALDYGADVVFCEEIIDFKMLQCKKVENKLLDTTDFVWNDGTVVFRTCPREKNQLIFQIGTSDASRAVQVANMVEDCVAGIDVNMGCPKEFSIKGGMGAALMENSKKFTEILKSLVKSVSKPISCKTRIKPSVTETLKMLKQMEETGVSWITLHGRLKEERPRHDNHNNIVAQVSKAMRVPLIANGGSNVIKCYEDISNFSMETNCPSVMLARMAMWNPSIFSKDGLKPLDEVIQKFLRYSIKYDNHLANTKYCLQQMMHDTLETDKGRKLLNAMSLREICELWDLGNEYDKVTMELEEKRLLMETASVPYTVSVDPDGGKIYEIPYKFNKRDFDKTSSPKMVLYEWSIRNKMKPPTFETEEHSLNRIYRTTVTFQGARFASTLWDKSKKFSEHASACVCITMLNRQPFRASLIPSNDISPLKIPYSKQSMNHEDNKRKPSSDPLDASVSTPNQTSENFSDSRNGVDQNGLNTFNAIEQNSCDISPAVKKIKLDI